MLAVVAAAGQGVIQHLANHWADVLTGAAGVGLVAHAVNTFPTPTNVYGRWLIGVVQYVVGQRISGANTMAGKDTVATAVPTTERAIPNVPTTVPPTTTTTVTSVTPPTPPEQK